MCFHLGVVCSKVILKHRWLAFVLGLSLSALSFADENVQITNIRLASNAKHTRIIFDLSGSIAFKLTTPSINNKHILDLKQVTNLKRLEELDLAGSLLENVQLKRLKNTIQLIFDSKQQTQISIKQIPPNSFYGDRLVLDFEAVSQNSTNMADESLKKESSAFAESKKALSENRYESAVLLFQALLDSPNPIERQIALEYYAIALEKSGKHARAKQAYQDYIERYQNSEGAARIKQRLSALITLEQEVVELKKAKLNTNKQSERFDQFGYVSQAYRYAGNKDDNGDNHTSLSSLFSNADITSRYRNDRFESKLRINASYDKNLLKEDEFDHHTSSRFSYFYFQAEDMKAHQGLTIGRQRSRSAGLSGKFDGIELSKQLPINLQFHLIGGKPVDRSSEKLFADKRNFYGLSADTSLLENSLDLNFFMIEQRFEGYLDRRAIGAEFKFYKENYNFFGLLDYDIHFTELNAAMLNAYYRFDSGASANASMSYRKSPYLTTRNALIGQQVDSIDEINNLLTTDEEIEALALDRTFDSRYLSLNYFQPISESFDLSTTLTLSNLSGTPESGGVAAIEGTGTEYYLSSQLLGKSILSPYDLLTLGINLGDLSNAKQYAGSIQWRYPGFTKWRIYPKLVLQMRDYDDDRQQTIINPSLSLNYRISKAHSLDLQTGVYLYSTTNSAGDDEKFQVNFANLVYFFTF